MAMGGSFSRHRNCLRNLTMPDDSIFPHVPVFTPPAADALAAELLRSIDAECKRRIGQHVDWWRAFWQSAEATPQQIADSMNKSAALFFGVASVNKAHILAACQLLGKTPEELGLPAECLTTPHTVTVNQDGSVTIGA